MEKIIAFLKKEKIVYFENEPMSRHTSFGIGGKADLFVCPQSEFLLCEILNMAKEKNLPVKVVGDGSGMLVSDSGIEGLVICTRKLNNLSRNGKNVAVGAGVLLSEVVDYTTEQSLRGLEFAAGLPGTMGGAVRINLNSHGGEIKDVISSVTVWQDGEIKEIREGLCGFGNGTSIFSAGNHIILKVRLQLENGTVHSIRSEVNGFIEHQRETLPMEFPNAGLVFKRPKGYFMNSLINEAGVGGYCIGGAQVSEKHPGCIINIGNATCKDVLSLIEHIKNEVYKNSGVMLEETLSVTGRK